MWYVYHTIITWILCLMLDINYNTASVRMRKKIKNYADIFGNIVGENVLIM